MLINKLNLKCLCVLIIKWISYCLIIGITGGLLGILFHNILHYVTELRASYNNLLYLLPIGGLFILGIYKLFKLNISEGTGFVLNSVKGDGEVSPLLTPSIFFATVITHLFGGSAGREGAALQMGGSTASLINKIYRFEGKAKTLMLMCGMSASFSGLFVTPFTAAFFTVEILSMGFASYWMIIPCIASSVIASEISKFFGVLPTVINLTEKVSFSFDNIWKLLLLAVTIYIVGLFMNHSMKAVKIVATKLINNSVLRILIGAIIIVLLTMVVGDQRFNGAGMDMAILAIEGTADWYSFILKLLFTSITLAVGFKGGEIVPTFCIGATFGCFMGSVLGLNPSITAALGLIGLFCVITKCPIASILLSVEMFGFNNFVLFLIICVEVCLLSNFTKRGIHIFVKKNHLKEQTEV